LSRIRRLSQILFLFLFLWLFLHARYPYESGWPADLYLRASPLLAAATLLSGRGIITLFLPALIVLAITVPLGRFFCGWICPLGTTIDASDHLLRRSFGHRRQANFYRFRSVKFFLLAAVLVAALFSWQTAWFFDPIAMLTRVLTTSLYPALVHGVNAIFALGFATAIAEEQSYAVYSWLQSWLLPIAAPTFMHNVFILMWFIGLLLLSLFSRRFWCRYLCPLGALLGVFSRFRLLQRFVNQDCSECGVCQHRCRMNAVEDDYATHNSAECILCAECVSVCKPQAITYRFQRPAGEHQIDFSRRRFLQASATSLIGLAAVKTSGRPRDESGLVIRPPGALAENEFFDRCIRCQACVRICASTGACLQPVGLESGWEGIWSPRAVMRMGYCEYNCTLCGQVCPSGAIRRLDLAEKQALKIGTAYFDKSRCIPWYRQEDCLVCEEHCPLPDKAIKFDVREARGPDGQMRLVKFPYVREDACIGCGICETRCPVKGKPGIFVTAAGEGRRQAG